MSGHHSTPVHGGNVRRIAELSGRRPDDVLDFSANINPLGPPEWLRSVIGGAVSSLVHYPDPDSTDLRIAASERYGVDLEEVTAANGSTEILRTVARAAGASRAVVPVPAYLDYAEAATMAGLPVTEISLRPEDDFRLDLDALGAVVRNGDLVFLGQPNNPTGVAFDPQALRRLSETRPGVTWVVDEAFADFLPDLDRLASRRPDNVIVLLSLTKFFAIPGLRLGCAVACPAWAERIRQALPPWTVNTLAQAVGAAALRDTEYAERTREYVAERRAELHEALEQIPSLTVFSGAANFLLARLDDEALDGSALAERLLSDGLAIRKCENFAGLDARYFRVAVRTADENARLVDAIRAVLWPKRPRRAPKRHTPALMVQGTTSNAGKSVLAAAFCRILLQDGFRVAPYKSQNMSLNSFVTLDGGEMGRAQVVQAAACRLDPDVRMNPILLKPNSDTGSQVIVNGKPVGNMVVSDYIRYKPTAFEAAKKAYDDLAAESDVVVIEGAGSPGEVNLKSHDIVNMAVARHAHAPVFLTGDIDRGGLFASFIGTMDVLAEWERRLVAGFIVNRFRGQKDLLLPAFDYVERHTGVPTLGVVPYLRNLGLPEEDSVEFKSGALDRGARGDDQIEVAVLDLPHISNFTDIDPFRAEPDVFLRVVRSGDSLGRPDAVILPGSKNVLNDLRYLRENGFDRSIRELFDGGRCEIVGLCGGLQMLGRRIADPDGVESNNGVSDGIGLLPVDTTLAAEKTLERVSGRHVASGHAVWGYEIHHGQTAGEQCKVVITDAEGKSIGVASSSGAVWGTYLHGVFDADEFRRWFIDGLRRRRGLKPAGRVLATYDLEPALERLAAVVRESVQMDEIYARVGL